MRHLIENGANVNQKDSTGRTAFNYAVLFETRNILPILLEAGLDVDANHEEIMKVSVI